MPFLQEWHVCFNYFRNHGSEAYKGTITKCSG